MQKPKAFSLLALWYLMKVSGMSSNSSVVNPNMKITKKKKRKKEKKNPHVFHIFTTKIFT